jgi:hypothetical protein
MQPVLADLQDLISKADAAFNARDIDGALALMHVDVEWPNGWEGGSVSGHAGVRDYCTRPWQAIDPRVTPVCFAAPDAPEIVRVLVDQIVRDLQGNVIAEQQVEHVYYFARGLIRRMEIVPT